MIYLIKNIFTINWATLASLLIGILLGAVLFVLIYTMVTFKGIKNSTYVVTDTIKDVQVEDVENDIQNAQKSFLDLKKRDGEIRFQHIQQVSVELIQKIASRFYPESKSPLAELTIEEMMLLDHYILEKFETVLEKRGLKPLKKLKLSSILKILNIKSTVDNAKIVKTVKKYQINKFTSGLWTVLNFINPAIWFKKLVISPSISLITKEICLTIIRIIGQETYHIYSKQAFLEPLPEKDMEKMLHLLNEDSSITNEEDKVSTK